MSDAIFPRHQFGHGVRDFTHLRERRGEPWRMSAYKNFFFFLIELRRVEETAASKQIFDALDSRHARIS
jgi:hypothetical protein